jgi:DNA-binding transcriptional ArsR family regulator
MKQRSYAYAAGRLGHTASHHGCPRLACTAVPKRASHCMRAVKAARDAIGEQSGRSRRTRSSQARLLSLLRVAGDATRLSILFALAEREHDITELRAAIGQDTPGISHHLALLRHRRLVTSHRTGKRHFYSATEQGKRIAEQARTLACGEAANGHLATRTPTIDPKLLEDVGGIVDDPQGWFHRPNPIFEGRRPVELLGTPDERRLRTRIAAAKLGMFS